MITKTKKAQQLKKGLAFIIVLMFSFSYIHAQCPGNKVLVCEPKRSEFGTIWYCKCVGRGQVPKFKSQGWTVSNNYKIIQDNKKILGKEIPTYPIAKTQIDNDIAFNKASKK